MEGVAGGEEGAGEAAGRAGTGAGSLEAVEDLALHAVLDLTPSQHELQHLVDGVLRVFLWGARLAAGASPGRPTQILPQGLPLLVPSDPRLAPTGCSRA